MRSLTTHSTDQPGKKVDQTRVKGAGGAFIEQQRKDDEALIYRSLSKHTKHVGACNINLPAILAQGFYAKKTFNIFFMFFVGQSQLLRKAQLCDV